MVSSSDACESAVFVHAPLRICWTSAGLSRDKPDHPMSKEVPLPPSLWIRINSSEEKQSWETESLVKTDCRNLTYI